MLSMLRQNWDIQTRTTIYLANKFNIKKSLDDYKKILITNKWKKWIY